MVQVRGPDHEPLAARADGDGDVSGGDVGGGETGRRGRLLAPAAEHLANTDNVADFAARRHIFFLFLCFDLCCLGKNRRSINGSFCVVVVVICGDNVGGGVRVGVGIDI